MRALLLLLLLQSPLERALLEVEDSRAEDSSILVEALENPEPRIQRIAVRALGRLERPPLAAVVLPLVGAQDPGVRAEAANALGQMRAKVDLAPFLEKEKDGAVRGVIYETMGRLAGADETRLAQGLDDADPRARIGAAKGLYAFFRATEEQPGKDTVRTLRKALRSENPTTLLKFVLLALNETEDSDVETLSSVLDHLDPQVRRLAVMGLETYREDPSHIVRYEALRVAATCERAIQSLDDMSEHVVLLAIDKMGELKCSPERLEKLVSDRKGWRRSSRALVSLARVDPSLAHEHLQRFVEHETWQARVYAARAAKIMGEREALTGLVRDRHPNVIAAALVDPEDGVRALEADDYGLLMEATGILEGWSGGATAVPQLLDALDRVTAEQRATSRDPRRRLLTRLREFGDEGIVPRLRPLLSDFDPVIAGLAAEIISEKSGTPAVPKTTRFETTPLPPQPFIDGLKGARARIGMKESGAFLLELLTEEAPVTVAAFARLAEEGYYNGLTFHRIAPNYVLQGGSPGANEFVGTPGYIRDELGLLSHERGTLGISTRGRDTGDSQIFINLVDNTSLDHNYTVFARIIEGMDNVDRIQEGDVMEVVEIIRPQEK